MKPLHTFSFQSTAVVSVLTALVLQVSSMATVQRWQLSGDLTLFQRLMCSTGIGGTPGCVWLLLQKS